MSGPADNPAGPDALHPETRPTPCPPRRSAQGYWHILATGRPYDELGADFFTRRLDPERETRRLIAKLEALGHQVSLQPAA